MRKHHRSLPARAPVRSAQWTPRGAGPTVRRGLDDLRARWAPDAGERYQGSPPTESGEHSRFFHAPLRRSRPARRPAIRLGAGTPHQHRALTVAQAVGLPEGLDGLLVVDDGEGASPVRAPQAAFETPGVEYAGQGVPDVGERIRFAG